MLGGKTYLFNNGILLPKLFWPSVRKKILVIEKNVWNLRLKAENFQKFWKKFFLITRTLFPHGWVSSTPLRVPFHVLVRFRNRGIISIIFCQWSVQRTFQQHFSIISKSVCYDFYLKRNVAFTLISFDVLKWDDCLSVQLPFELTVQIPDQLLLELDLN